MATLEDAISVALTAHDVATRVKLVDLEHNMDTRRLIEITATDRVRLEKYRRAKERLLA